jgi:hypothetical protein
MCSSVVIPNPQHHPHPNPQNPAYVRLDAIAYTNRAAEAKFGSKIDGIVGFSDCGRRGLGSVKGDMGIGFVAGEWGSSEKVL